MQKLNSMLPEFKLPPDEELRRMEQSAREWEERRADAARRELLKRSDIPQALLNADILLCSGEIQRFSENPQRNLLLQGKVGRGKSYAACALLISQISDYVVRFSTMLDILRDIKRAFGSTQNEADIIAKYRNVRVLVIDDLGKGNQSAWTLSMLFDIIDSRLMSGKTTYITTQYSGKELLKLLAVDDDLETPKAIVSRLATFERIVLEGDDRRLEKKETECSK